MWVLIAVAVVVVGFALRLNAMLVVAVAGIVAALIAHLSPAQILDAFGTGFAGSRTVTVYLLALPVIGLLERNGLQQQARRLITRLSGLTTGRLLASYLFIRQATAALGLNAVGGPAQAVRPIVVPMAEGSAERRHGPLTSRMREKIRAFAASADNVGLFFGEDLFVAVGSILLITGFVDATYNLKLDALHIAVWSIPTGICALLIHGFRMLRLDRTLTRLAAQGPDDAPAGHPIPPDEARRRPLTPGEAQNEEDEL